VPSPLFECTIAGREIRIVATHRGDGDVHPERVAGGELEDRQIRATGRRWTMLDEVHGVDVIDVTDGPVGAMMAGTGDVMVTKRSERHLAVWTADCAPIFLLSDDGSVVAAHAGWRGLANGVVDVAVETACCRGGSVVAAVLGPTIGPCCYEFGQDDLGAVADGVHASAGDIVGATIDGGLALDVVAAVRSALRHHGIELDAVGPCTGCDDRWFSHRVRTDRGRHATIAMIGASE
jgi:YfiH family protein